MKKKLGIVLLIMVMGVMVLTACGDGEADNGDNGESAQSEEVPMGEEQAPEEIDMDAFEAEDPFLRVNDEEVLFAEFEEEFERSKNTVAQQYGVDMDGEQGEVMIPQIQEQAVQALISQRVMLQEAEDQGIEVTDEDVDENIAALTQQFGGEEGLEEAMEAEGLDDDSLRGFLRENLMIEKLMEQNLDLESIEVTEEEKEDYYAQLEQNWEEQGQESMPYEEVEEEIALQLQQQKQQEMQMEYLQELMDQSDVERLYG